MKIMPNLPDFMTGMKKRNANPKSSMHSLELVVTVILFVLFGRFLDSQFDTLPVFTLLFTALGFAGSVASAYYRYLATSKVLDENKAWDRETTSVHIETETEPEDGLVVPKGYGENDR